MDDTSDLSTQECSDLYDKIYQRVCMNRPWEFLRATFSDVQSTTVPYIALPSDFGFLLPNYNYQDSSYASNGPVALVGSTYEPVQIISMSNRNQYRNNPRYAYIDILNSRIVFMNQPTAANAVQFDYASVPTNPELADEPVFPERFHDVIYHGMCIDSFIIQQSDKAKSYADENESYYNTYIKELAYWNAQLIQM